MSRVLPFLLVFGLIGGFIFTLTRPWPSDRTVPVSSPVAPTAGREHYVVAILAPLIDHGELDALVGEQAGTARLRVACYWLEVARRDGAELEAVLDSAQKMNDAWSSARADVVQSTLLRNHGILDSFGCLDAAGMEKLVRGYAPTITKGPYAGELAEGDRIIPESVCPELGKGLVNLEFVPATAKQRKSSKVGERQAALARKWNQAGVLSDEGLARVETAAGR